MKKRILCVCMFVLINIIFIDIISAEQYNNYQQGIDSCGGGLITQIPSIFPKLTSIIFSIIQVAVPIVLVILGSLDLVKGITAQKEDEIKKGQQLLIKRIIYAVLIFLIFVVVKLFISLVADNEGNNSAVRIIQCTECFVKNKCD